MKSFATLLVLAAGLAACESVEVPELDPPRVPLERRPRFIVEAVENRSPLEEVSGICSGVRTMLSTLLVEKDVGIAAPDSDHADLVLDVDIVDVTEELRSEGVLRESQRSPNTMTRTSVILSYACAARGSLGFALEGTARGEHEGRPGRLEAKSLAASLASGAFWNEPHGRATRAALDAIVEAVAQRAHPVAPSSEGERE